MSAMQGTGYPNGRPSGPACSATELLEHFEDLARAKRRSGKPALPTREDLARDLGHTVNSVRNWCAPRAYNLPWPLFRLDEAVVLIDALGPRFEFLYSSPAFCDLLERTREELHTQSSAFVKPGWPDRLEDIERRKIARALKEGEIAEGHIEAWLVRSDGTLVRVDTEMRYCPAADAYFVRVTPLPVEQLSFYVNVLDDFYLDGTGTRQPGLPPPVMTAH